MENSKEILKPESLIEPLTSEERGEFDALVEMIQSAFYSVFMETTKNISKCKWQIVEKFGERAVPYLIDAASKTHTSKLDMHRFLNTLVTEKTAPLVLRGMQEGKVDIYNGALAAAEGKEKTALGLAELLVNLRLSNSNIRSDHIELLEALSVAGVDETAPYIVKFYENLRQDKWYAKETKNWLKENGVDLYGEDASDVVIALAKINGKISRNLIETLAKDGDNYIKGIARAALNGELYLGSWSKFVIKNPEEELNNDDFYSTKFNPDLEISLPDPYKKDEDYWPKSKPEKLTQSVEVEFLDSEREISENDSKILHEYLHSGADIWETLGALSSNPEAESLKDFTKDKMGEAFAAATLLELFKSLTHLPDYTALRNSFDDLEKKTKDWTEELKTQLGESPQSNKGAKAGDFYLKGFQHYIKSFVQEDFRLTESAKGFTLWHEKFGKERRIKPFTELFFKKMEPILIQRMSDAIKGGTLSRDMPNGMLSKIKHALGLYRDVSTFDVPIYEKAAKRLEEIAKDKTQVFYGRDADYFYYAVKALRFGLADKKKLRKVYINRELKSYLRDPHSEVRERILAYLLQEKVTADAVHIDTGFSGSVPEAVLQNLNPELKPEEINERIKLLKSSHAGRESVVGDETAVDLIENRPHAYGDVTNIQRDEKTGRLKVVYHKEDAWKELEAWVVSQAVIRYFAPKKQL